MARRDIPAAFLVIYVHQIVPVLPCHRLAGGVGVLHRREDRVDLHLPRAAVVSDQDCAEQQARALRRLVQLRRRHGDARRGGEHLGLHLVPEKVRALPLAACHGILYLRFVLVHDDRLGELRRMAGVVLDLQIVLVRVVVVRVRLGVAGR